MQFIINKEYCEILLRIAGCRPNVNKFREIAENFKACLSLKKIISKSKLSDFLLKTYYYNGGK